MDEELLMEGEICLKAESVDLSPIFPVLNPEIYIPTGLPGWGLGKAISLTRGFKLRCKCAGISLLNVITVRDEEGPESVLLGSGLVGLGMDDASREEVCWCI